MPHPLSWCARALPWSPPLPSCVVACGVGVAAFVLPLVGIGLHQRTAAAMRTMKTMAAAAAAAMTMTMTGDDGDNGPR